MGADIYHPHKKVSDEEIEPILQDLTDELVGPSMAVKDVKYYKVPFEQAVELVKNRQVICRAGGEIYSSLLIRKTNRKKTQNKQTKDAYVPEDDFSSILAARFRAQLNESLTITSKYVEQVITKNENINFLKDLPGQYVGTDYSVTKNDAVDPTQIDAVKKKKSVLNVTL